jgi:hypothetical protein
MECPYVPESNRPFTVFTRDLRSRENLDAYIAVVLGVVLAVLGVLGVVRFELLASGILLTMSFVVWAALANRHAMTNLKASVERLQSPNQILRFAEYPDPSIRSQIRAAKEISLSGLSMFRFFPVFFADIEEALRTGATLRVLLTDPHSAAVEMASFRSEMNLTPEIERQRILGTMTFLAHQISQLPNTKIEVRLCPYLPPYSITIINPADSNAKAYCHARLLPFRSPSLKAPLIIPDPNHDSLWFQFFESQFQKLWDASSQETLALRQPEHSGA